MMTSFGEYIDFEVFWDVQMKMSGRLCLSGAQEKYGPDMDVNGKDHLGIAVLDGVYLQIFLRASSTFHICHYSDQAPIIWPVYFYFSPF